MPTATNTHTTPTRRSALGFSVAAIVAGFTVPAIAGALDPDAKLRELVKTLNRQWEVSEIIAEEMHSLPGGITPQSKGAERRMDDALGGWWGTVDQIIETPASSPSGLRAKAEAVQRVMACMTFCETNRPKAEQLADADADDRLAWSLAADILALGGVA
jgi:hypothetical protein